MTNAAQTGPGLAGTTPDGTPGAGQNWASYWLQGGTGTYNTLSSPTATYPGTDMSGLVGTPLRGPTGTTFTLKGWNNFNSGASIPVNAGSVGLITAQTRVTFGSSTGGWAAIGLDSNIAATSPQPADLYNNHGGIEMILRPVSNGSDYAEFFINTFQTTTPNSFATQAGALTTIPASDNGTWGLTHIISITLDPVSGIAASYVDGSLVGSGTLSNANRFSFDNAADLGLVLSTRYQIVGDTGQMSATYSDLSATQAPEPAASGCALVSLGIFLCWRRARQT